MSDLKHKDITEKIIGAAMRVHAIMGNGFQEVVYQRALAIEMKLAKMKFEREYNMKIYYRGEEVGERRVDFYVENLIMVELKALTQLENVHLAQAKIIWKLIIWKLDCLSILVQPAFNLKG